MAVNSYITLYAEDFTTDAWEYYCRACVESANAIELTIKFDCNLVEAVYEYEGDEE